MLASGCYANCRDLLTDKNLEIVTASIELMANMSLCEEEVTRFTSFNLEIDIMISLFKAQWATNKKMRFAIVTFMANNIG
jgi:hypothetical protein